ncbi:MAG: methyltransferase domain-containing protein [Kofleriaceae bacterium]
MTRPVVVCPGCRVLTDEGLSVRTLEQRGEILRCECGRSYPILGGVPLLLRDPAGYVQNELASIIEGELSAEVQALLASSGPDDAPYARLQEHLSIYLDAHWGDRAEPAPDGPTPELGAAALLEKVAARAAHRVGLAIELGCSVGRFVAELARGADHVVGLDLHLGALRRARRLLAGEDVIYNRRVAGRHYRAATARGDDLGDRVSWICSDALDPPLLPGEYGRVVALNLLDSVSRPAQLLQVLDGLCAPGGELLLASPYAWQSGIVEEDARLGGADPAAELAARLQGGVELRARYELEEEDDVSWTLRKDQRSAVSYRVHYLRARKLEA